MCGPSELAQAVGVGFERRVLGNRPPPVSFQARKMVTGGRRYSATIVRDFDTARQVPRPAGNGMTSYRGRDYFLLSSSISRRRRE
jgi:hypothetical protein